MQAAMLSLASQSHGSLGGSKPALADLLSVLLQVELLLCALNTAWVNEWQLGEQREEVSSVFPGELAWQRGAGEVCNPLLWPAKLGIQQEI